tara:strand:- start:18603 stop:18704 length:102 start_codon:yes stop_codon:yes gene_type:complete
VRIDIGATFLAEKHTRMIEIDTKINNIFMKNLV